MKIFDYLTNYLESRKMPMPVYTDGSKITEEAQELREALKAFLKDASVENRKHLQEEVADVVFTATIAAHRGGFTVEEALSHKIEKDKDRGSKPMSISERLAHMVPADLKDCKIGVVETITNETQYLSPIAAGKRLNASFSRPALNNLVLQPNGVIRDLTDAEANVLYNISDEWDAEK